MKPDGALQLRSGFGLNELLDVSSNKTRNSAALICTGPRTRQLGAEDAANKPGVASAGVWTKREEQGAPDIPRAHHLMTNKPASISGRDNSERPDHNHCALKELAEANWESLWTTPAKNAWMTNRREGNSHGQCFWGLTPELSRPARQAAWSLEATKRVRLE